MYIAYETNFLPYTQGTDFRLRKSLFGDAKLVEKY